MESFADLGYLGLFAASFLAATILPLSSEVVLSVLLVNGLLPIALVAVATVGNVLGSLTNYGLGYWAGPKVANKWLKISEEEFIRAEQRFKKYGLISLCFAWVPVVGDPITVVAGVLRIRLLWFVLLVTAGKLLRYIVISVLALQVN